MPEVVDAEADTQARSLPGREERVAALRRSAGLVSVAWCSTGMSRCQSILSR